MTATLQSSCRIALGACRQRSEVADLEFDRRRSLASVSGPGGFTQVRLSEPQAEALAQALSLRYSARVIA